MLVLQVASGDFFSTYGGGQVYVKNIVDEFIRQRYSVSVLSFVYGSTDIQKKDYKGIDLYEINPGISEALLKELIIQISPDIIHAHSHKAQIVDVGKDLNIPVVVTAHHGGIICPAGTLMNSTDRICNVPVSYENCLPCVLRNVKSGKFWYPLLKRIPYKTYLKIGQLLQKLPFILFLTPIGSAALNIARKQAEWNTIADGCACMIAPCYRIAESMILNGMSKDKITVLPHGIPLPDQVPTFPKIEEGRIKFFYVGRICYVKGIHVLLEAFSKINDRQIELHLIGGAGNKTENTYMKSLMRQYKNDHRIVWHGKVDPSEVYSSIADFHIAVHPTICMEIFGLNIAEALTMDKPVLATRCGGAEMQIEDGVNGWLVEPNSIIELKEKIEEIISNISMFSYLVKRKDVISVETHSKELYRLYEKTAY